MDFEKDLQQFIERLITIKDSILTEEATKTSLIMPFFTLLGYDVFNPLEFTPEYIADVGIKKGEKVDYAILTNSVPMVLIEAKSVDKKLGKHGSQLFRYFAASKAKFAILTNGIQYRFYTDLDEANKMDTFPFLQIDLLNIKNSQIDELKKFRKEAFNVSNILDAASVLKYKSHFKEILAQQMEEPGDDLIKIFLQEVYSGVRTQAVISKFRPILKQAMEEYINETMNDKIKTALNAPSSPAQSPVSAPVQLQDAAESETDKPALSAEETQGFERLKLILSDYMDVNDLAWKKTENYVAFLFQNNTRKWVCRFIVTSSSKYLIMPDENKKEIRCFLSNWFELDNYGPYLIKVINRYCDLLNPFDCENVKVYTLDLHRRFPKMVRKQK